MADALEEENWWTENGIKLKGLPETEELNDDASSERKPVEGIKPKRRKKRRITEELKGKELRPGKPHHLIKAIQKHYKGKLSSTEWDQVYLDKQNHFFEWNTEMYLPSIYLNMILPKWNKMKKYELEPGQPLMIILASSAIRAVNLNRLIEGFKGKDCKTAKLFAKHFKIEDHKKFLEKNLIHIGIGTPKRLQSLIQDGSLSLKKLRAVVLDWNWRDGKLKRLVDNRQIWSDLTELLKEYIFPYVHSGTCKIGLL